MPYVFKRGQGANEIILKTKKNGAFFDDQNFLSNIFKNRQNVNSRRLL